VNRFAEICLANLNSCLLLHIIVQDLVVIDDLRPQIESRSLLDLSRAELFLHYHFSDKAKAACITASWQVRAFQEYRALAT
jgi:hypothetical protein